MNDTGFNLFDWVRVCAVGELLPGEQRVVWDGDTPILVVNVDGLYFALEDRCSHEDFELSAGAVRAEDASIECVLHGARFDLASGRALCPPAYAPVTTFLLHVHDGALWTRDGR